MKVIASPAPFQGFAARLCAATRDVHRRAEKTAFITGFLRGTATRPAYTRLLASLHSVYQAMEEETVRLTAIHPVLARFHFPALQRTAALERDLVFLAGPDWIRTVRGVGASRAYVERIHRVAEVEPVRLVGHLYTRYMGDLSGGRVLAGIAERSLGLSRGAGLDFYDFPEVADTTVMKSLFRARLDELGALPEPVGAKVIDEARIAFRHNIAIFEQLEGNAFISFLRNLPLPGLRAARIRPFAGAAL
jgi:heme oxygenase (biliverdin-producing, ferredoxin)